MAGGGNCYDSSSGIEGSVALMVMAIVALILKAVMVTVMMMMHVT